MRAEWVVGKKPFEQGALTTKGLRDTAETMGMAEKVIPTWLATLLSFRKEDLEKMGVLMIPEEEGTRVVVSKEPSPILEAILAWEIEDERAQRRIKKALYPALFRVIQASITLGVDEEQIKSAYQKLARLSEQFPPLKDFAEKIRGGDLTDLEKRALAGMAHSIFAEFESTEISQAQEWIADGMDPRNMFKIPDEGA